MGGLIQKINERKSIRTEDIMGEISYNTSLDLLTLLDGTNKKYQINSSTEIAKKLSISARKYHKLVARIKKLGLIKLGDSGLQLSSLGVIVVRSIGTIYNALDIYSKLRAIDIISMSDATTEEEIHKLIDSLIKDEKIKNILKRIP
jgi:Mn-dependent DtxR family transcriptional regulator